MALNPNTNVTYSGKSGPLFTLALITGLLTLITVGIYRFWAKTRLRKYIWSSVSVEGDAFEYTGTGLEKLLGFLMAIVFLAIYLAVIQLIFTFLGLGILAQPDNEFAIAASFYVSFFALVPFMFFAVYRARRYKLARTRLRGIRFGMDKAAWGYALRAIGHYLLTGLTLGLLLPRQTFYLEKFMTDRSYYGDAQFLQGGRWQNLYNAFKHVLFGLGLMIVGAGVGAALTSAFFAAFAGIVGYFWLMIGFVHYRVHAFAYLTRQKTLGGVVRFHSAPSTAHVIKRIVIGGLLLGLATAVVFGVLGGIAASFIAVDPNMMPNLLLVVPLSLIYLVILVFLGALFLVTITQPIIAHLINTLGVLNVEALETVRQRAADKGGDAEGFAEALDIGGAL